MNKYKAIVITNVNIDNINSCLNALLVNNTYLPEDLRLNDSEIRRALKYFKTLRIPFKF